MAESEEVRRRVAQLNAPENRAFKERVRALQKKAEARRKKRVMSEGERKAKAQAKEAAAAAKAQPQPQEKQQTAVQRGIQKAGEQGSQLSDLVKQLKGRPR